MKTRFFKIVLIIACIATISSILGAVVFVESVKKSDNYATFDNDKLNQVYSNLTVLDDDGNLLNEAMYYKNIKQVPLTSLQKYTYMAFVAVEDKRFFAHKGIDVKRVAGALLHNVKSGSLKEGASTISQQLIKNTHLDNSKNFKRKVNEMLLAMELEQNYTKNEILEMYLNTIYFGRNAYGIENAANVYFDKSARELTISESAILAGMIKAPNIYAPDKNIEKCKARRNLVLDLMCEQKIITDEDCTQAKQTEITYTQQKKIAEKTYMYYVLKEACQILNMTEVQLLNSNYTIETFCQQDTQHQLCEIAHKDRTTDKNGNLSQLACVLANNCGQVEACYMRGENADIKGQVGSTFKPIAVYAPALNEKIITQASPVLDEPTNFNGYLPQNASGQYNGWTTIKHAVTKSLNVPAVKTLNCLTLPTAERYLAKFGFTGGQNLSLALGNVSGGATPFELAKCYTSLANNGMASELKFVKAIRSNKGTIYKARDSFTQVFKPSTAFLMTDMLRDVVDNGTAKMLKKNYQVAAKTGTVGSKLGNTDAIVAGYTTNHTFVVWHRGDFDNSITGSNAPCKVASQLLDKIYQENLPNNFAPPKGVVKVTLDKNSLDKQQLKLAKKGIDFWFDETNRPTEKVEEISYSYTIDCVSEVDKIVLTLPDVSNGKWQLFQEIDGKWQLLPITNNGYKYNGANKGAFIAKLYIDGQMVYQTPKVEVTPINTADDKQTEQSQEQQRQNFLDFWYWK